MLDKNVEFNLYYLKQTENSLGLRWTIFAPSLSFNINLLGAEHAYAKNLANALAGKKTDISVKEHHEIVSWLSFMDRSRQNTIDCSGEKDECKVIKDSFAIRLDLQEIAYVGENSLVKDSDGVL